MTALVLGPRILHRDHNVGSVAITRLVNLATLHLTRMDAISLLVTGNNGQKKPHKNKTKPENSLLTAGPFSIECFCPGIATEIAKGKNQ